MSVRETDVNLQEGERRDLPRADRRALLSRCKPAGLPFSCGVQRGRDTAVMQPAAAERVVVMATFAATFEAPGKGAT